MTTDFDALFTAYRDTRVHVDIDSVSYVTVPEKDGEETPLPGGYEWVVDTLARRLGDDVAHVWVVTAENPESTTTSQKDNRERTSELRYVLSQEGYDVIAARGASADNQHAEMSYAVVVRDGDDERAAENMILRVASQFCQNAVFCFRGQRQFLVGVVDENFCADYSYRLARVVRPELQMSNSS